MTEKRKRQIEEVRAEIARHNHRNIEVSSGMVLSWLLQKLGFQETCPSEYGHHYYKRGTHSVVCVDNYYSSGYRIYRLGRKA